MADEKKRNWVKITDETKRRLTHLSVDAGAASVEEYAGDLLTAAVNAQWSTYDPKRPPKAPPKRPAK